MTDLLRYRLEGSPLVLYLVFATVALVALYVALYLRETGGMSWRDRARVIVRELRAETRSGREL